MRISSHLIATAVLTGALAACSGPPPEQPQAEEGSDAIECALGEGSEFGADCLVERSEVDGQKVLTIRHPDGGFRRFEQLTDGRGLAEMDGADTVSRSLEDGTLLISIGPDRYRFPAAVKADPAPAQTASETPEPAPEEIAAPAAPTG
ncbi:hypothetical protein [Pontixanthobacter sp.]|uniref:hypothetical protein n=1 Tax=Pontixanthobacter sp. TaxID=2792078 RepID=UPI003C7EC90E